MPLKVVIPPASYTLASHVPIFLAMFLSRKMAACVVIGSTLGFFVAGFPIVIVMRCISYHLLPWWGPIILNIIQAYWLGLYPLLRSTLYVLSFTLLVKCLRAYYSIRQLRCQISILSNVVFVLVGGGTIIHSIVDGYIALYIYKAIPGLSKPENK